MTKGGMVLEATGFDDGEEVPAEFGFGGGGEEEGDDEVGLALNQPYPNME